MRHAEVRDKVSWGWNGGDVEQNLLALALRTIARLPVAAARSFRFIAARIRLPGVAREKRPVAS
jgi:hypothetical protein